MAIRKVCFDAFALAICLQGFKDTMALPLPPHLEKGGNWQFLTNLASLMTCLYLTLELFLDFRQVLKAPGKSYFHFRELSTRFGVAVGNIEFLVSITYWSLIFFFPYLLNSDSFDVCWRLDFEIHLFPLVYINFRRYIVEISRERPSIEIIKNFKCTFALLSLYWTFIEVMTLINSKDGVTKFPYPFMNDLSHFGRFLWFGGFIILAYLNIGLQIVLSKFSA